MRGWIALFMCGTAGLLSTSCASERLIERSGPTPDWVRKTPDAKGAELLFSGQGLGRNVLDEKVMRDRAMEDIRSQIAGVLGTRVESEATEVLRKRGYDALGADEVVRAEYEREIRQTVDQQIHAVRQKDKYWEKWRVDPGLFRSSFIRYKYVVLAGYPKAEYDRNMAYFTRLAADQQMADELMKTKPKEAAALLEKLLTDYPKASIRIRLRLAEAYERAQMLDRAEEVLKTALTLKPEREQRARIRERIRRLRTAIPKLDGVAFVVVTFAKLPTVPAAVRKAWFHEPFAKSGVRLAGVEAAAGRSLKAHLKAAADAGAGWLFVVTLHADAGGGKAKVFGSDLHVAQTQCTANVYGAGDGKLLAAASTSERGLAQDRNSAVISSAKFAARSALRKCFLTLAAR